MIRIVALAALACTLASAVAAQTPAAPGETPGIVTTGEGLVKRVPDRAWVNISAESRARSPREAQRMNADAMSAVLQKLKGSGLSNETIRTVAYDLQPEFDHANGRQTLRGYVARNTLEVRIDDLPKLGEILDVAVTSGATSVGGVRFDLKDRDTAEREALRLAVADARGRADAAAAGAGVKIVSVLRIQEHREGAIPPPRPMMMAMRDAGQAAGEPPVSPGQLEIRATVTLTTSFR